jgi:predicted membrane protein
LSCFVLFRFVLVFFVFVVLFCVMSVFVFMWYMYYVTCVFVCCIIVVTLSDKQTKQTPWPLVRERNIPTDDRHLSKKFNANICG